MIVSDVGRMISSSSSFASGSTIEALARDRLEPVVRDDGALLGEALGHLLFLGQERLGNEQREVGVDVAGVLEHAVEGPLHLLPDGVAVRLDDHAAADVGVLGQPGVLDDVEIPLRIVLRPRRDLLGHETFLAGITFPCSPCPSDICGHPGFDTAGARAVRSVAGACD